MDANMDNRSLSQLISDLAREASTLVRQEVALAKTEMSENISEAGQGLVMIAAGALLAFSALLILLLALVAALSNVMPPSIASLVVGLPVAGVAFGLIQKGRNSLRLRSLVPSKTARQLGKDSEYVKEKI